MTDGYSTSSAFDAEWRANFALPPLDAAVHGALTTDRVKAFSTNTSVSYRASVDPTELGEIRLLHTEWFPVQYNDDFYESLLNGSVVTVVAVLTDSPSTIVGLISIAVKRKERQYNYACDLLPHLGWSSEVDTVAYILTLGVVDELRRHGLGQALLAKGIEQVRVADPLCRVIFLHVIEYNRPAIRMYQRNGFTEYKMENNFYNLNGKWYYGILFYQVLTESRTTGAARQIADWLRRKLAGILQLVFSSKRRRGIADSSKSCLETV